MQKQVGLVWFRFLSIFLCVSLSVFLSLPLFLSRSLTLFSGCRCFDFFFFETGSCFVTQANLELSILLPQPSSHS